MNVIIYFPPSAGCENSGKIVSSAIAPALQVAGGNTKFIRAPIHLSRAQLQHAQTTNLDVDCAIFMESIIDHPALLSARHRILIPNPEWLDPQTQRLASTCTHIWHKSRFSLERLKSVFPHAQHAYLGFTSRDPGQLVSGYDSFLHLRGSLSTHRNTNSIFTHWKSRPSAPGLHVQCYSKEGGGIEYPGWLSDRNIHVRLGWLDRKELYQIAARHGIHLCTSEVEGFGHYINEARAMGALVITTDGAPMNELVDENSGILVKPSSTTPLRFGTRYIITPDDLAPAIDRTLSLSLPARRAMGATARERFLADNRNFYQRAIELFTSLG